MIDNQITCAGSYYVIQQEGDKIIKILEVHANRLDGNYDEETKGVTLGDEINQEKRVHFSEEFEW